jgi:hypothetical protein
VVAVEQGHREIIVLLLEQLLLAVVEPVAVALVPVLQAVQVVAVDSVAQDQAVPAILHLPARHKEIQAVTEMTVAVLTVCLVVVAVLVVAELQEVSAPHVVAAQAVTVQHGLTALRMLVVVAVLVTNVTEILLEQAAQAAAELQQAMEIQHHPQAVLAAAVVVVT